MSIFHPTAEVRPSSIVPLVNGSGRSVHTTWAVRNISTGATIHTTSDHLEAMRVQTEATKATRSLHVVRAA